MQGMKWNFSRIFLALASLRRDRRPVVRMGDALGDVARVLLVLPLDSDARQRLLPQIFGFKAQFPDWTLDLLFLGGDVPVTGDAFKGIGIVRGSIEDLSAFGLPRRDLVDRLRTPAYDLAIDLSMTAHPFVPWLLERARVPLRMGVNDTGRMSGRLYNLMVRTREQDDVMTRLADTLGPICKAGAV